MEKIKVISNGKMNSEGWKKLGKSFLLTMGAEAIVFIGSLTQVADFGSAEVYIAAAIPFVINFLRKWLGKYESKL